MSLTKRAAMAKFSKFQGPVISFSQQLPILRLLYLVVVAENMSGAKMFELVKELSSSFNKLDCFLNTGQSRMEQATWRNHQA